MDVRLRGVGDGAGGAQLVGEGAVGIQREQRAGAGGGRDRRHLLAAGHRRGELVAALIDREQARQGFLGRVGDVGGRPANLLQAQERRAGFDGLELGEALERAHDLHPAQVGARVHLVDLGEAVVAVLGFPEAAGGGIHGDAEPVAHAVGEDLLEVGASLAAPQRAGKVERVVGRSGAIVVQPENDAGQMRVVRLRSAELVVGQVASRGRVRRAGSAFGRAARCRQCR